MKEIEENGQVMISSLKKSDSHILLQILSAINICGAMLHFAFEFTLDGSGSEYREFLLIENILIGFTLFFSGISLLFGDKSQKKMMLFFQIIWWSIFSVTVIYAWGGITTLSMLRGFISLPESLMLLLIGILSTILSVVCLIKE